MMLFVYVSLNDTLGIYRIPTVGQTPLERAGVVGPPHHGGLGGVEAVGEVGGGGGRLGGPGVVVVGGVGGPLGVPCRGVLAGGGVVGGVPLEHTVGGDVHRLLGVTWGGRLA